MKRKNIKLGGEFFSNQRTTSIERHSIAFIFEHKRHEAFLNKKKLIKINPSLLPKTKRVQFSLLRKVKLLRKLLRKRRIAIHFDRNLLTELHVFQKLRKRHSEYEQSVN